MQDFLSKAGWGDATVTPITPDWSPRHYHRVTRPDGATAIFLQGPEQEYRGHGLRDFVAIGAHLARLGLSVPEIYAEDLSNARLLMEDFGNTPIDTPDVERAAYETAIDVLAVMRTDTVLAPTLPQYEDFYVFKKTALFATQHAKADETGWMAAWQQVIASLPPCPHVLTHIDYKAGNLHWLLARDGVKRIGILDYQAAQNAPFPYDCMTLLEDARRMLDPDLKAHLKARYRDALPDDWKPLFDLWYPVVAAQFHSGVLGQIAGRDDMPVMMRPRLETYLRNDLAAPALKPVTDWVQANTQLL